MITVSWVMQFASLLVGVLDVVAGVWGFSLVGFGSWIWFVVLSLCVVVVSLWLCALRLGVGLVLCALWPVVIWIGLFGRFCGRFGFCGWVCVGFEVRLVAWWVLLLGVLWRVVLCLLGYCF